MKHSKSTCFIVLAIVALLNNAQGQSVVHGEVTDADTKERLSFVNVYLNNTTMGTVSEADGGYNLQLPNGEWELVFSFIGYHPEKFRISAHGADTIHIDAQLKVSEQVLDSVVIRATKDKQWQALVSEFSRVFLGKGNSAALCTIRNAWCIEPRKEKTSGRQLLTAIALQPLEIDNLALGYKVYYELQHFSSSRTADVYNGNVYFVELKPKDRDQAELWASNRRKAYAGSGRHLFKSILTNKLGEEGFKVSWLRPKGNVEMLVPYDPARVTVDSATGRYVIPMDSRAQIEYANRRNAVANLVSSDGRIEVDGEGILLNPLAVKISGYLGRARVADLLPYDYRPPVQTNTTPGVVERNRTELSESQIVLLDSIEGQAIRHAERNPSEKVYIHFDKPYYVLGEDSWYKAYVVDAASLDSTNISSTLYVDWISPAGKVVEHQKLRIKNGAAIGDFTIDTTRIEGTYLVRAYTNWMRNEDIDHFYTRKVQVFDTRKVQVVPPDRPGSSRIDLQFLPEGGSLVTGINTQIAFRAIDANGREMSVNGQIVDEKNQVVTTFRSAHNGLGVFPFTPERNKSYTAILPGGERYDLPMADGAGLTLTVSNRNPESVFVSIDASRYSSSNVYLVARSRGSICFAEILDVQKLSGAIAISKEELPEGVVQFTLFDEMGVPRCERLVFVRKGPGVIATVENSDDTFTPRDSVSFRVKINSSEGMPLETSLSLSVTDADFWPADANAENIYTRLLLQSDIKGSVESPSWYFDADTPDRNFALDLVMLTHGWSRFQWTDLLAPVQRTQSFRPEGGITLQGEIRIKGKPAPHQPFLFMIPQIDSTWQAKLSESDSLGQFVFYDLEFYDTTRIAWRLLGKKNEDAEIHLFKGEERVPETDYVADHGSGNANGGLGEPPVGRYLKKGVWNQNEVRLLDEVVVRAERPVVRSAGGEARAITPDALDIKYKLSTLQLVYRYIGGMHPPLAIGVNGVIADGSAPDVLAGIPIEDVVNVIIAGDIHDGFFVYITTKATAAKPKPGPRLLAVGYDAAREFYHPKYHPKDPPNPVPDKRVTLYWNPDLKTDKDGIAVVKFYNNDSTRRMSLVAEGLSQGSTITISQIIGRAD